MKNLLFLSMLLFVNFVKAENKPKPINVEVTKTEITCFGYNNGKIELLITGGKSPYNVKWSNGEEGVEIDSLKNGEYQYQIVDNNNDTINGVVYIDNPKPLSISFLKPTKTEVTNFNSSMDVVFNGGNPWDGVYEKPFYMVRIDGKSYYKNPELINNGIHKMEIEDSNGCKMSFKVNLNVVLENGKPKPIDKPKEILPMVNMVVHPYHLM